MPQWYKDDPRIPKDQKKFYEKNIKHCVPFLDALTIGYHIVTPQDLLVTQEEGKPKIEWNIYKEFDRDLNFFDPIDVREKQIAMTLPTPAGFADTHFVWALHGAIELPKGYSAILTHPLNQHDLPFYTLSGVVDDYTMHLGNLPFFIKEGFEGVITKGTPLVQVIPFKRENWESKEKPGLFEVAELNDKDSSTTFRGWYKNNHWKQKKYN